MQIPVYVIYELLIRLQELSPIIGDYLQNKTTKDGILVQTSMGIISISEDILFRQFNDPSSISKLELLSLLENFQSSLTER